MTPIAHMEITKRLYAALNAAHERGANPRTACPCELAAPVGDEGDSPGEARTLQAIVSVRPTGRAEAQPENGR